MSNNLTLFFNKVGLELRKHSPEILLGVGIVGTVASAVLACKATTKLDSIMQESKKDLAKIHEAIEHPENLPEEYTPEDGKKDLAITYAKTGLKLVKLYAPSVALGALSITSILASHNIVHKRNVALTAAYAAVDKGFKEYRGRVIDRFGEELDKELKYNIKAQKIEEKVVDEKTGKEKKVKKEIKAIDDNKPSDYARFLDDGNIGWNEDPEASLFFLRRQQDHANELLRDRGYLFLNEVYDMLGIPRTKAGQIVGWYLDKNNDKSDCYVDFGIYDISRPKVRDFVNGYENVILLDFNVDGPIYQYLRN